MNIRSQRKTSVTVEFHQKVILSLQRFSHYSTLKKAALMIIAHQQSSFQDQIFNNCFLSMDTTNQGFVTFQEFKAFINEKEAAMPEREIRRIFRAIDQDRTNAIRFMEFLAASLEAATPISERMINDAFNHLDIDHTGYITLKSLQKLVGKRTFSKSEMVEIIRQADIVGDSRVSRDEFMVMMQQGPEEHRRLSEEKRRSRPKSNTVRRKLLSPRSLSPPPFRSSAPSPAPSDAGHDSEPPTICTEDDALSLPSTAQSEIAANEEGGDGYGSRQINVDDAGFYSTPATPTVMSDSEDANYPSANEKTKLGRFGTSGLEKVASLGDGPPKKSDLSENEIQKRCLVGRASRFEFSHGTGTTL